MYYVHANNVLPLTTDGQPTKVSAGDVVGVSGASPDGYEHLHLEIRDAANPNMVYNPMYFFAPDTWNSMGLVYMPYHNNYANPETRMYAMPLETGNNYWNGPSYPLVLVR